MKITKIVEPKHISISFLKAGDVFETLKGEIGMFIRNDGTFIECMMFSGNYQNQIVRSGLDAPVTHHKNVELTLHPETVNNENN